MEADIQGFPRPVLSTTQAPILRDEHSDLFQIWTIESYKSVVDWFVTLMRMYHVLGGARGYLERYGASLMG